MTATDDSASLASDLLRWAFAQIDWHGIADAWIEAAREAAEYAS
jgi:hypothetical protein